MNIYETAGLAWIIFTSAIAHIYIVHAAYRHTKRMRDLALRGEIEERRDVIEAMKVRSDLTVGPWAAASDRAVEK